MVTHTIITIIDFYMIALVQPKSILSNAISSQCKVLQMDEINSCNLLETCSTYFHQIQPNS